LNNLASTTAAQSAAASSAAGSSASTATGSSAAASSGGIAGASLGGTDFLTLMLAQLKNQDPTSPVDSNTFLTQLAQLTQVQGITQLNTSFSQFAGTQATSLLGHTATVPSSTAALSTAGQTINGSIAVPQNSPQVTLNIKNASGSTVQSIGLGPQPAGLTSFSWNGTTSSGAPAPAGTYTLSAQVAGTPSGTTIGTYVNGTVESVTMGAGAAGLTLNVAGLGSVPYSSVQQISN
jgi:flagellar basal-body rod modification protein FlgD